MTANEFAFQDNFATILGLHLYVAMILVVLRSSSYERLKLGNTLTFLSAIVARFRGPFLYELAIAGVAHLLVIAGTLGGLESPQMACKSVEPMVSSERRR